MRPNNLLTTLLYVLLAGLIIVAIYKGYEMKREQQSTAQEDAEMQRTMNELQSVEEDTLSYGSAYLGDEDTAVNTLTPVRTTRPNKSTAGASGIEDEEGTDITAASPSTSAKGGKTTGKQPVSAPYIPPGGEAAPVKEKPAVDAAPKVVVNRSAKYMVVAGSFSRMDGARRRLEEVIKAGYQNAEIGKTNNGKYAIVIAARTNNEEEARRIKEALMRRGFDARVDHR